jgi:hypothetical protein
MYPHVHAGTILVEQDLMIGRAALLEFITSAIIKLTLWQFFKVFCWNLTVSSWITQIFTKITERKIRPFNQKLIYNHVLSVLHYRIASNWLIRQVSSINYTFMLQHVTLCGNGAQFPKFAARSVNIISCISAGITVCNI